MEGRYIGSTEGGKLRIVTLWTTMASWSADTAQMVVHAARSDIFEMPDRALAVEQTSGEARG